MKGIRGYGPMLGQLFLFSKSTPEFLIRHIKLCLGAPQGHQARTL